MTPEQYGFLVQYVTKSSDLLTHIAARGTRYSRDVVRAYQTWYNANLPLVQAAFAAQAAEAGQSATQTAATIRAGLGELTVDGLWGSQTATRTALFAASSSPPAIPSEVSTWWRARQASYNEAALRYANLFSSVEATNPPPRVPQTQPSVVEEPPANVRDDAGSFETITTPSGETGFRITARKPAGSDKVNWFAWLGLAAVVGVGGFLAFRAYKKKQGGSRSAPSRPKIRLLRPRAA